MVNKKPKDPLLISMLLNLDKTSFESNLLILFSLYFFLQKFTYLFFFLSIGRKKNPKKSSIHSLNLSISPTF